mmetsp:Transcript_7255/g.17054  ORF Transcript_7255/g.17054 Transcript_7255/m.17054 type:complete len:1074 (+) Transcript_7255:44-3265(+)
MTAQSRSRIRLCLLGVIIVLSCQQNFHGLVVRAEESQEQGGVNEKDDQTEENNPPSSSSLDQGSPPAFGIARDEDRSSAAGQKPKPIGEAIVVDLAASTNSQQDEVEAIPEPTVQNEESEESNDQNAENAESGQQFEDTKITDDATKTSTDNSQEEQPLESRDESSESTDSSSTESLEYTSASSTDTTEPPISDDDKLKESSRGLRPEDVEHIDQIEDSFFDPLSSDPSCEDEAECYAPPDSTVETETIIDATCLQGGGDHLENDSNSEDDAENNKACSNEEGNKRKVDKHWGNDEKILSMRNQLQALSNSTTKENKRPPIFLVPGLASTRLVAWKFKKCTGAFASDIKVQDNVWLNLNLVLQMGTVDVNCLRECLQLGLNQSDTDDWETGCKLRPDEGLDAIASLAPGGIGSDLLIGGTNTVYAWLIQWLADNLGYDVSNIVGLPYDWRLTPDKMEERDGFLTMMRKRIEGSVATNGHPGIMIAHSMGNVVFRYFLEWLRIEMRKEAYNNYMKRAKRRARSKKRQADTLKMAKSTSSSTPSATGGGSGSGSSGSSWTEGWMTGVASSIDDIYEWLTSEEATQQQQQQQRSDAADDNVLEMDSTTKAQLWELAVDEGDANWLQWIETHIWTYVGLSALHLGAINPLRAVISGEHMGLPITDEMAREMELSFGSTNTMNAVSTSTGFCDDPDSRTRESEEHGGPNSQRLACLDDIAIDIEAASKDGNDDPWKHFPALKSFLGDRVDWNSGKPMIDIEIEHCQGKKGKRRCVQDDLLHVKPKEVESGEVFRIFNNLYPEEGDPLIIKKDQLDNSFGARGKPNVLNHTWDRPLIKHVIMAYGVDVTTESGYIYNKQYEVNAEGEVDIPKNVTGPPPDLKTVFWEQPGGTMTREHLDGKRGSTLESLLGQKKVKEDAHNITTGRLARCGDGAVPYLSLSWAHTWLLHAERAKRASSTSSNEPTNPLDSIEISHRPQGENSWIEGPPSEKLTIVNEKLVDVADKKSGHPHGTRYKPEMIRYHNAGVSRKTGIQYTTTVIEAVGVEHKEATRNYDLLAAVFTDALKYMHDDLNLIQDDN